MAIETTVFDPATIIWYITRWLFIALIIAGWFYAFYLIAQAYIKRRKRFWVQRQRYTTLVVTVPRNNDKGPQSAMYFFAALHGIYKNTKERLEEGSFQEHISFEIVSHHKSLRFFIHVPTHLKDFLVGQLYAQYPLVEIKEVDDYALVKRDQEMQFIGTELSLTRKDYYPIKTFQNFDVVDPLAGITSVLSQIDEDEQIWTQILVRPAGEEWQKQSIAHISALRSGRSGTSIGGGIVRAIFRGIGIILREIVSPTKDFKPAAPPKLSGPVEQAIKAIENKSTQLGYEVKTRIVLISKRSPDELKLKMQSIVGAFKQYNASNLNGFTSGRLALNDFEFLNTFQTRQFEDHGFILNIEELASLYHLPTALVETPNIVWAGSKKGEPPSNLPIEGVVPAEELTVFGQTNFRGESVRFGIKLEDRLRHTYIIGQTGTGKSTTIENMVIDDMREGRGLCVVDPHGELVDTILKFIPRERLNDLILVNPGDKDFSVGFNLLENTSAEEREQISSSLMTVFNYIWDGWSDRMQTYMKNTLLALMETPGTTFLSIPRMWNSTEFRAQIVANITDTEVADFWTKYEKDLKSNPKYVQEATAALLNKIGQFLSVPKIRAIVGQTRSTINMREIMDGKKILLIKLSKGEVGEDNIPLLGSLFITKIKLTAMERAGRTKADMPEFFLYVDEFQNFINKSFADILAEARKYRLGLVVAHQFMSQITDDIRSAILGNVGTAIMFRAGSEDTPTLVKFTEPVFAETDIMNLANYHIYVRLLVDGLPSPAFSAVTIAPYERPADDTTQEAINISRANYAIPRTRVEEAIKTWAAEVAALGDATTPAGKLTLTNTTGPQYEYREVKDKKNEVWYIRRRIGGGQDDLNVSSSIPDPQAASLHENFEEVADARTPQATVENELSAQFETDFSHLFTKSGNDGQNIKPGTKTEL